MNPRENAPEGTEVWLERMRAAQGAEPELVESSHERAPGPRVLIAYGTRPERIKLAPVAAALRAAGAEVVEWCSGQSADLVEGGCSICWSDGLPAGLGEVLAVFAFYLRERGPFDAVVVQGDTATAFACAQAAFLARVPVAHVEAGLRTYADEPWPEEVFRRQIGAVARWHFAPDDLARANLVSESDGNAHVFVVGNPVIDTLPPAPLRILATLHRRENWGKRIEDALWALHSFALARKRVQVRVISHPNWRTHLLNPPPEHERYRVLEPLERADLLEQLAQSSLVVTDSGGLQEEAAHFGVPVLVLRTSTERTALVGTGAAQLVDPDELLALPEALLAALKRRECYGAGDAAQKIAQILMKELQNA